MSTLVDVSGKRFGKLVAEKPLKRLVSGRQRIYWRCRCDCGRTHYVESNNLLRTNSCGCSKGASISSKKTRHGHTRRCGPRTDTYSIWAQMVQRCTNSNHHRYKDYGGRGITVCRRWLKYDNFLADMGERPTGLTLDRKNNDKGYYKRNCRWATRSVQANNMHANRLLTYKGRTLTMTQWTKKLGFKRSTLPNRLSRDGWSVERALSTPVT